VRASWIQLSVGSPYLVNLTKIEDSLISALPPKEEIAKVNAAPADVGGGIKKSPTRSDPSGT